MSAGALFLGGAALLLASLCALADGALLAPVAPAGHAPDETPGDREQAHRALSLARLVALLVVGMALVAVASGADGTPNRSLVVATALALLVVAFVDGAARAVGHALGDRAAGALRPLVRALALLLAPVLRLAERTDAALLRAMPPSDDEAETREASAERFLQVVAAEAEVSSTEEAIMHGVFALGETEVREVMVPRVDMVALDRETPWAEVVARVRSAGHARIPVFAGTVDEVVGVLYAKDLLAPAIEGEEPAPSWHALLRRPTFIPTTKPLDLQLRDFKASRTHIAIVIDEFGGTAGLVTIEDVLEEIVGEIRDEYDDEEPPIEQEEQRRYWVAGRVSLDQLCEVVGHDLTVEGVTTVGGLAYHLFGRVPRGGESQVHAGFRLVVERVRRRRIERVYLERLDAAGEREDEA